MSIGLTAWRVDEPEGREEGVAEEGGGMGSTVAGGGGRSAKGLGKTDLSAGEEEEAEVVGGVADEAVVDADSGMAGGGTSPRWLRGGSGIPGRTSTG